MKLCLVCSILWPSFLVLWALQVTEGNNQDVRLCRDQNDYVTKEQNNSTCLLYPTNVLNCSWSFPRYLDTHLSVSISVCHDDAVITSLSLSSNESVGSRSLTLQRIDTLQSWHVKLQFDVSLHNKSEVKTHRYMYRLNNIEVQPPPSDVSATVKDGTLLVTWRPPPKSPECFEYELDLGDQENVINFSGLVSYPVPNADPSHTYRVKIRTRKTEYCVGSQWSEWSPTVTVERSFYQLNTLAIILISLGIPMILLAVLLLVRQQRVSELLFPPIPQPPPKYKHFLEKTDMFSFSNPVLSPKAEEEITRVEETE